MDKNKIIYWIATGLLSALYCFSAGMYIFNNEFVTQTFVGLGYPGYLVWPLAGAKLLAVAAILTKKSKLLKDWAYVAIFFNLVLAFFAHVMVGDGEFPGALVGFVLWSISYVFDKKLFS